MPAAANIDFESARLAVQIEHDDILIDLDLTRNPGLTVLHQEALKNRLAALESYDAELQQADSRYAGQRLQQSMYRAMLSDNRAIVESR